MKGAVGEKAAGEMLWPRAQRGAGAPVTDGQRRAGQAEPGWGPGCRLLDAGGGGSLQYRKEIWWVWGGKEAGSEEVTRLVGCSSGRTVDRELGVQDPGWGCGARGGWQAGAGCQERMQVFGDRETLGCDRGERRGCNPGRPRFQNPTQERTCRVRKAANGDGGH